MNKLIKTSAKYVLTSVIIGGSTRIIQEMARKFLGHSSYTFNKIKRKNKTYFKPS